MIAVAEIQAFFFRTEFRDRLQGLLSALLPEVCFPGKGIVLSRRGSCQPRGGALLVVAPHNLSENELVVITVYERDPAPWVAAFSMRKGGAILGRQGPIFSGQSDLWPISSGGLPLPGVQ
jgi:hypothetical protein